MSESPNQVSLSSQNLRGIAHPLRVRLLSLLREDGPSTATRLAERVGQSSGATSYHLRQLAAYGFVQEHPQHGGTGRERWWRATHRGSEIEAKQAREAPVEAEAYMRAIALEYADRVDRFLNEITSVPTAWDQAMTLSDYRLRLTPTEATALLATLAGLIAEYRRDDADTPAPDGAERVVVQLAFMPFLTYPRDAQ